MISRLFGCCNDANAKTDLSVNINANANTKEPKKIQWSDTLQFIPPINTGQVIKVYDWDTFTLAGHLPYDGSPLYRFSVRLNGIDCLNIKCKTGKHLEDLIMGKTVTLKNVKNEKYGRLLADVFVGDLHVNKYMLDE
jgi:endonuclease YncB( thermonuclease family)